MPAADQYEQQMLALINAERAKVGLQALTLNSKLNGSAETHSKWMLNADVFSHTGAGNSDSTQRMRDAGFVFSGTWMSGENIAWTTTGGAAGIVDEVAQLHTALMNSPGHKANILKPGFAQIGIGIELGQFTNADGQTYTAVMITQNFALSAADNGGDGGSSGGGGGGDSGTPVAIPILTVGADKFMGTALGEAVDGLAGNDAISGLGGNDTLVGGAGNDKLYGGDNNDNLSGGIGNDLLQGDLGDDLLSGGDGNDKSYGGDGQDTVLGDAGNDFLSGGTGNDSMDGRLGNDKLYGEAGNDTLDGGAGADRLDGGDGNDDLDGGTENDRLVGGAGDDVVDGGAGADLLAGDVGNDTLYGGEGDDQLSGGEGNDALSGEAGNDRLTGGLGEDHFIFVEGFGADEVRDFVDNVDKLIFDCAYWLATSDQYADTLVNTFAEVVGNNVVFDFGNGDVVTVMGVNNLAALYDDVWALG
jgi:serralysin